MWREVTEADVLTAISGTELEAYRDAALQAGQADPVAPTISQVVNEVRGYVDASGRYSLGDGETVPEKLVNATVAIVVARIPARVGMSAGEAREKLADNARKLLESVAAGRFGLEEPETPDTEESSAQTPSFKGRARRQGRER